MTKKIILSLLLIVLSTAQVLAKSTTTIVYNSPAERWHGAIPLGNGRIGAMVYGGVAEDRIALNEVTMWCGEPDPDTNNLCGPEMLKKIRDYLFKDDYDHADSLAWHHLVKKRPSAGTHLPLGDIVFKSKSPSGDEGVSGYSRTLDMTSAVARVKYTVNKTNYSREYFCSNPSQALIIRYTAKGKGRISGSIEMDILRYHTIKTEGNRIIIDGDARFKEYVGNGVKYRCVVSATVEGGTLKNQSESLNVENATALTIRCDIRTDFQNPDFEKQCLNTIAEVEKQPYKSLLKKHVTDFSPLFSKMEFNISNNNEPAPDLDTLLASVKKGKSSALFDELFFNYGRYMLLSASRKDSPLPANLQGIWNDNLACNMGWSCDYHLDINIQQNYWSANIANMAECNEPVFKYIELLSKYGHETAKKMYGCDGWVAHTMNNVWGSTIPGKGLSWAVNVSAGAWMATHLWTHYEFTQDINYLRQTGYPLLKATAQFFMDYMVEDPRTGYLVTGPSISPETAFTFDGKKPIFVSMMPTIDRGVVYDIYSATIQAAQILDTDHDMRARLERDILRLPPLSIGKDGALKEWQPDGVRTNAAHRHASHLVVLYPFGQISTLRTPKLAESCRRFLDLQTKCGWWEDTEWTRGNLINFYARLCDKQEAYASLQGLYHKFICRNLMTVSPSGVAGAESDIFSFDGNEAAVAGVCEMLLQSYDGYLNFLPALPEEWSTGNVHGICARGGIEADIEWKNGQVTRYELRSAEPQTVNCMINGKIVQVATKAKK